MSQAQNWLIVIILLLLGLWLLWVWFGFEPDLAKNSRSLHFVSSAAYADFLTIGKPNQEARRLTFLRKLEQPVFVEFVKLGFRQLVADDLQFELVRANVAFPILELKGTNGEWMLVACTQQSVRKNPTWIRQFGHLCQINQVGGFFIHLGVTSRSQIIHLNWRYPVHLLSGSRLIYLLTCQASRLTWFYSIMETKRSSPVSPRIIT